jgi:hypothetical protein
MSIRDTALYFYNLACFWEAGMSELLKGGRAALVNANGISFKSRYLMST